MLCFGARPRYNLVVDEDVKKPTNQPTNQPTHSTVLFDIFAVQEIHGLELKFLVPSIFFCSCFKMI